jgi:hypothetical protein
MRETLRIVAAGATGALFASAVLVGQPALAGVASAAKNSVTSKSIKNGTVKTKDLAADVNASLAKANSALQSVPDNSVTSAKVADSSLTAGDLAASAVGSSEVADGTLTSADVTTKHGTVDHNFASIANGACDSFVQAAGTVLAGDLVIANADLSLQDGLTVSGRSGPGAGNLSSVQIIVCNFSGAAIDPNNTTFSWAVIEN